MLELKNHLYSLIENEKVLVQFSGGKDSACCVTLLSKSGINIECIHFTHQWGYDLPTIEAKRLCNELDITLTVIDISEKLKKTLLNNFSQRPCRECKAIMDQITVDYAMKHNYKFICVGDTYEDHTLYNRLLNDKVTDLYVNTYFNKKVSLPTNIKIIRPLIEISNMEIFEYLNTNQINIKRVNDTGDKYFEYSREGCPLQFKDYGVKYSEELLIELQRYNNCCSEFATKKGIRASIHLPSKFIVTIPKGYESECSEYLNKNNFQVEPCIPVSQHFFKYSVFTSTLNIELNTKRNINEIFSRFFERLSITLCELNTISDLLIGKLSTGYFSGHLDTQNSSLDITFSITEKIDFQNIENLIVEIFHTNFYKIDWTECTINGK